MNTLNTIPVAFVGLSLWFVVKVMVLIILLMYIVFAFVIVKQVSLMQTTLDIGLKTPLKLIANLHLLLALGIFVLAFLLL